MLIEARAENCLPEVSVLAAALSTGTRGSAPAGQGQQADAVHAAFRHPDSDFLVLLNIWNRFHGDFEARVPRPEAPLLHKNFLSFPRMREWTYLMRRSEVLAKGPSAAPREEWSELARKPGR
jgi:ATP-dependent helicase HrpA